MIQVYGLGQCTLDHLAILPSYPKPDTKCEFREMTVQGGGPAATAMVALSRWGIRCAFAGAVGDDAIGAQIRRTLDDEGVDTSGLLVRRGSGSQFAFIAVEAGTGRRTIFWRRPSGAAPAANELDRELIRQAKVVHTDGLYVEASVAAARMVREAGGQVVVDAGTLRDGSLELAKESDCFIASAGFARALIGEDRPLDACRRLAELGPRVVGVTRGEKGYVALDRGMVIKRPAYRVKAVDTTGCGDVFHAGFIYGLVQGWDAGPCLDFGAWAAARVSLRPGGRDGIPSLADWPERKLV
ncbi:MAG TPA: PfkB family carbohydrate kinase [Verrucomicrobiae bacterium]|nr:PfkB family carbohydrate kinase [Verrucomicrobiae bacterium]